MSETDLELVESEHTINVLKRRFLILRKNEWKRISIFKGKFIGKSTNVSIYKIWGQRILTEVCKLKKKDYFKIGFEPIFRCRHREGYWAGTEWFEKQK